MIYKKHIPLCVFFMKKEKTRTNRKRIVSQTFLGMIWKVENVGTCKNAENSAGLRPAPRGVAHTNDLPSVPTLQRGSAALRAAPRGVTTALISAQRKSVSLVMFLLFKETRYNV